ncbi:MAG: c-type cytochrome [Armatimonadetes bacterium]|nr:c-type cytochrome [Armatimonadota bacterium]MBS1712306.1 c-type cytochrome [Armatimonadota bacterium]MBX3108013.1 c-type cytochrome [Fimbriimonadaceae bacterium]
MKPFAFLSLAAIGLALAACSSSPTPSGSESGTGGGTGAAKVAFSSGVGTILEQNCVSCHSGDRPKEGIDVSSYANVMKGGEHGPIVVAGKSDESVLYKALTGNGAKKMPPGDKGLSQEDIDKVKAWIDSGAAE